MTTFKDFCDKKKEEGFVIYRNEWRKIMRKLAIQRKHEKRLNRELESAGCSIGFSNPTDLKNRIVLLEDIRKVMSSKAVNSRVYAIKTEKRSFNQPPFLQQYGGLTSEEIVKAFPVLASNFHEYGIISYNKTSQISYTMYKTYPTSYHQPDEKTYQDTFDYLCYLGVILNMRELLVQGLVKRQLSSIEAQMFQKPKEVFKLPSVRLVDGMIRQGTQQDGEKDFSMKGPNDLPTTVEPDAGKQS